MTGPVASGAEQFDAKLGSFVRENRLYGAAAGIVHGGVLVWSGGAGYADLAAGRLSGPDVLYRIASITKTSPAPRSFSYAMRASSTLTIRWSSGSRS